MFKLSRRYLAWWAVGIGTLFLIVQVMCDLWLPNITSDIINNGVAKSDISYIWNSGYKMLAISLLGVLASGVNVFCCYAISTHGE